MVQDEKRKTVARKPVRIMDRNEQKERDKLFRQSLGKFFIDLSKLVFAGVVLVNASSIYLSENKAYVAFMMISGLILTFGLALLGYLILKRLIL